jgi:hypothetical protein
MSPTRRRTAPRPRRHRIDRTAEIRITQAPPGDDDALFDTPNAAAYLQVSTQWLELGRCKGYGPAYVKQGRLVRYRKADIIEYLRSRRVIPSAEVT